MQIVELYGRRFRFDEKACNRIVLVLLVICVVLAVLVFTKDASAGDRELRNIITAPKEDGTYEQVPHLGECNTQGCVIMERITNGGFIHQWLDIKRNGVCDIITVWKPLDDPTYGRFYSLMRTKSCNNTM